MRGSRTAATTIAIMAIVPLIAGSEMRGEEPAKIDLWNLARSKQSIHRFSTIMTAQNVRDHLATDQGINAALEWCRQNGVTKVYVESFRDRYLCPKHLLKHARDRYREEDFEVSGCVTTTQVGKRSTGWAPICCFTKFRRKAPGFSRGDLRRSSC
jgi:hypothetical protein